MHEGVSPAFEQTIAVEGAPDILWVEGAEHPAHLELVSRLGQSSFKVIYSKDWKPWNVKRIETYDLCFVDEEAQAARMRKRFPDVHAGVWDKLIEYDDAHVPLGLPKEYDVCYVAYFRQRKNHLLLVDELAKLKDRNLRTVFVGGDRKGQRSIVQARCWELGLDVTFVDEVSKEQVNELVNRSRIGVMAAEKDAAPRVILEYLAANVPIVVNADLRAGARYVDERSGIVAAPDKMHEAIAIVLDNYDSYTPRESYLSRFDRDHVIETFTGVMAAAGKPLEHRP
jgi:glycosyltransferase involved in cell wall biosynthesis